MKITSFIIKPAATGHGLMVVMLKLFLLLILVSMKVNSSMMAKHLKQAT